MKKIKEYHVEYYWAEQAAKRERRAELKQKLKDSLIFCLGLLPLGFTIWMMFDMIVEGL